MSQKVTQHKVQDGKNSTCKITSKITQRKIGKILSAVQEKLTALVKQNGNLNEEDVQAAMNDYSVKKVILKNVKNQSIQLVHSQSNQPIYKREMSAIGQKGEKVLESPVFDEAQEDP